MSLLCFEIRVGGVTSMLRWPDRRSATTISVAGVWGVGLCPLIIHQYGGSSVLALSITGSVPIGTDCVLLPN
jgi:hypothetical protein